MQRLNASNGNLPVIFHLDGSGGGTIDSPAQHFTAALQYSANGGQVTVKVVSINAGYTATVNGNRMSGNWSQNGGNLPLTVTKAGAPAQNSGGGGQSTSALQGDWQGTLSLPTGTLPVIFHLDGSGGGIVDSPAQRFTAPLQCSVNGSNVTITVASINASFAATVNGKQMGGTWSQNGGSFPLTVTKH